MGFQRWPSTWSILVRMPEILQQPTVRAGDSHQAISRRDILKWGIASSVLLAALTRSVQLLVETLVLMFYGFDDDVDLLAELVLEYSSLVWIFPIAFAAFTIHALRKPVVFQHFQIRAVRYMKIVVAVSVPCLVVIWTFAVLTIAPCFDCQGI
jgi:hypothetical protein